MSTYIAPTAMAAARGSRALVTSRMGCEAGVFDVGADDCPTCGRDVFGCSCEPAGDADVANEVRAAIADAEARRAKAVAELRTYQGLAKDLRARVAELESGVAPARQDRPEPAATRRVDDLAAVLGDYVARLVHGPKRDYAAALVASVLEGCDAPPRPDAGWVVDVDRKVARWQRRCGA